MAERRDTVIITGSSGFIGEALLNKLAASFRVIGLDLSPPQQVPSTARFEEIDLTSDESVDRVFAKIRKPRRGRIASVIHLAAYFDLTGEPDPRYEQITVRGTERLLRKLQSLVVEQFVFVSSMLVHRGARPEELINENWPLESNLPYRASKIETERLIHAQRDQVPVVYLRPAGVYDDLCHNAFLAHQISRIFEDDLAGHVYPGDLRTGQSYLHLEDLIEAVSRLVESRKKLPPELPLLLGEPKIMGYGELQSEIGRLINGTEWETWEIPEPLAKAGAWVETDVLGEEPFIRPWMVDIANDHYAIDISRARRLLDWEPQHSLRSTLPKMIAALKADPVAWYRANKLNSAKVAGLGAKPHSREEKLQVEIKTMMPGHMADMSAIHDQTLWCQFLVIALGAWLLTSPLQFALFDPAAAAPVRDITAERGLWGPVLRNVLTGWSDVISGVVLMLLGALALSPRFAWAQWGSTIVGLWLLFAPLVFWTPSAGAYVTDTIVGALAITFSVLVPMMPGMSRAAMMDQNTVPPGWTYSPSSWLQRLPIITLGFFGFLIARYLAAYQLGQISDVWEPFFSGSSGKNGTEFIITSNVSRAWPIADAGLGASSYLIEALMGAMGSAARWRMMPWMVTFFFILVVPLGGISIFFIIIQPIIIGTYCTLCLIAAFAMLIMIPLAIDEVVAMGQYMMRSVRAGRPFWRTFLQGGDDPLARTGGEAPGFSAPLASQLVAATRGVTVPWTLLASCGVGAWLMLCRLVFSTEAAIANSNHLVGALVITIAVCAMAEVARSLRFINILFGLWLIAAPWLLANTIAAAAWNDVISGMSIVALSLPRGKRSDEHYGAWDRHVV